MNWLMMIHLPKQIYNTAILERYLKTYGVKLEKEYKFIPGRRFRADYAIVPWWLLIEIEGAVWVSGRHTRGSGFVKDIEKYNLAMVYGWQVLRLTPQQFRKTQAVEWLEMWCKLWLTDNAMFGSK